MHPTVDSEEETLDDRVERSVLLKRSHQQRSYNSNRDLSDTRKKSYQQQQINPLPPFDTVGESHSPAEGQSLQYSGGEGNIANLEYDPDMLDRILAAEDEYLQQDEMVVLARQVPPVGRQIMTFEALDALDVTEDMDELLQEGLELFHSDGDLSSTILAYDENDTFFEQAEQLAGNNADNSWRAPKSGNVGVVSSGQVLTAWRERVSDADNESPSRSRSRSRDESNEFGADTTGSLSSISAVGKMNSLDLNISSLAKLQYPFPTQYAQSSSEVQSRTGSSWTTDSSAANSASSDPPSPTSRRSSFAETLPKEGVVAPTIAVSSSTGNYSNNTDASMETSNKPPSSHDASFSSSSIKQSDPIGSSEKDKRGNYRCGRCGQPKVNHVCAFVDLATAAAGTQTESNRIVNVIDGKVVEPLAGEKFITVGKKKKVFLSGAATGMPVYCTEAGTNKNVATLVTKHSFASFAITENIITSLPSPGGDSGLDLTPPKSSEAKNSVALEKEEASNVPNRKDLLHAKKSSESATLCPPFVSFGI